MQSARQDLKYLATQVLKGARPAEAVVVAWPLACGSAVAARTQALAFTDGILWVVVPDAEWKAQLEGFSLWYSQKLSELSGSTVNGIRYEVTDSSTSNNGH